MSSPLTEAVIGSITSQFDPEKQAVSKYMSAQSEEMRIRTEEARLAVITKIDKLIGSAKDTGSEPNATVLEAYDRILVRLSAAQ